MRRLPRRLLQPSRRPPEVGSAWYSAGPVTQAVLDDSPHALCGDVDDVVRKLRSLREEHGISYVTVQQHNMEKLAPVVVRLAGA